MQRLSRASGALVAAALVLTAVASYLEMPFGLSAPAQTAGVIVALLAILFARGTEEPEALRVPLATAAAAGAAAALLSAAGWFGGSPGFSHDWKWPLTQQQLHELPAILASTWLPWGSGAPAVQAVGSYPVTLGAWALGWIVPPQVALLALIAGLGALGGISIAALAAACGLRREMQVAVAFVYAVMPAWFDRLCAGHLAWLLGYALFPLSLAIARAPEIGPRRRAAALGAIWGIAGAQIQFLLFFPLCALAFLRSRIASGAAGFAFAAGLQLPALVAIAIALRFNSFSDQHANLSWQAAQSEPLFLSLVSAADPAHYFRDWQSPAAFWMSLAFVALAGLGAARSTLGRVLGALWIAASLWSSGLAGPLAAPFSWLFLYVPQAIALREFAHAQALVAPIALVLAALGIERVMGSMRALPPYAIAAALVLAALPISLPGLTARAGTIARAVPADAGRDAAAAAIASLAGDGQVLWWPGLQPLAAGDTRGGVDSDAFVTGAHAPYAEYLPTPAFAQTMQAFARGDSATGILLAHQGVQAVVVRDSVRSLSPIVAGAPPLPQRAFAAMGLLPSGDYGAYHIYRVAAYRGNVAAFKYRAIAGDWFDVVRAARRTNDDAVTIPPPAPHGCAAFRPTPAYTTDDVRVAWVPLVAAPALYRDFDSAFDDVVVTSDRTAVLPADVVLAASPGAPYRWMRAQTARAVLARGPLGLWLAARCGGTSSPPGSDSTQLPYALALRAGLNPARLASAADEQARGSVLVDGALHGVAASRVPANEFDGAASDRTWMLWVFVALVAIACVALAI